MSTAAELVADEDGKRTDLSPYIRDLTDEELATFEKNGWVHAPNFINKELCDEVIDHFVAWTGIPREWPNDPDEQKKFVEAVDGLLNKPKGTFAIRQEDPWMFNFVMQQKFGKAAAQLLNVPSVKVLSETLHAKFPKTSGRGRRLAWHQDFPSMPIDRAEAVQTWIALVPMTPEMGPMVHLTGSHRSMPGGMLAEVDERAEELYPHIFETYEASEREPYQAGDAMFHHGLTWHSSGDNMSDKVRWAMSSVRFSARSRYTGQANYNTDGLGLEPRKPFDHPNFPTVYP